MIHAQEPSRTPLAQLPTPLVDLKNLARLIGAEQILIKRDDLTGLETTGNKVRKLEYVVADALASGADTLVTNGGFQSNHCRATAAIGARLGLRVRLILRSPDSPANDGNLFLDRIFGADISLHSPQQYNTNRQQLIDEVMQAERDAGRRPYFFPVGASIPLGCWGYIRCIYELAHQIDRDSHIDLYVPVSSSGTLAGLLLGRALFNCDHWRIVGVPVSDSAEFFRNDLARLMHDTIEKYQLRLRPSDLPIELLDGFIGDGYAIPYPAAIETLRTLARTEGILLDPTYTSKAMTGFLEALRQRQIRPHSTPVFLHTGGAFGLMARRDLFEPA